jgi:NAD(P)-dependent dehydrogenase (short-subunit alcohol dehydrogenase family)
MSGKWTVDEIPDLSGKVIIVTGSNSGTGFEAAKEFARNGAHTILACRNMEKARVALTRITEEVPDASIEAMPLDLASLESIHQFTDMFKAKYDRLDVLLNNAGIMFTPYGKTEDGFEQQFGVNHLGHFALTGLLLDVLTKTPQSRVVNHSSTGHTMGEMNFDDLMFEQNGYSGRRAYGRSKLANLLFTYELQRRFECAGFDCIAVAAHPGVARTNLGRHMNRILWSVIQIFFRPFTQSAAMGALPIIRASVDPEVKGGEYYGPGGFMEMRGHPTIVQSNAASHNEADAHQLWEVSEQLTGVHCSLLSTSLIESSSIST